MFKNLPAQIVVFFAGALIAFGIDKSLQDEQGVLQVLGALVLFFLLLVRFVNVIGKLFLSSKILQSGMLIVITLFIDLLVISTGGLFGPFFVVIHIATLAFAFLTTFSTAGIFLLASFIVVILHLYTSIQGGLITPNPALTLLNIASVMGIVPLAFVVARRYHARGELLDSLSHELSKSRGRETAILGNIEEGIITLDRNLSVVHLNSVAENITRVVEEGVRGKSFFQVFSFKDSLDNTVLESNFPIGSILERKLSFRDDSLFMGRPDGTFFNVDIRFSPIINLEGNIEGLLFVFSDRTRQARSTQIHTVLERTSNHLYDILTSLSINSDVVKKNPRNPQIDSTINVLTKDSKKALHSYHNLITLERVDTGEMAGLLTRVDVGDVVREAFQENLDLASEYKVQAIGGTPYSPNLPVKANRLIFKAAIAKLIELAIFIASKGDKQPLFMVETGSSTHNIFVIVKTPAPKEFPWESIDELFNPFFGKLASHLLLSEADGIEGYLARLLLEQAEVGGGVEARSSFDSVLGTQFVFTVKLNFIQEKSG